MASSLNPAAGQPSWGAFLFQERYRGGLFLVLALYVAFGHLSHPDFWGKHTESRRAEIAREFLLADGDLLIPRLNGEPILTKPPVFYWLTAGSYWLTGQVSEASARLPSVVMGLLATLMMYAIGSRWMDRTTGFLAAAMLISSAHFFLFLRLAEIDMTFCALIWLSLWYLVKNLIIFDNQTDPALQTSSPSGPMPIPAPVRLNFVGFWIAAGLAFMTKGPYALIFPIGGLAAAGAAWGHRRTLRFAKALFVNPGAVLFLLISVPWFLYLLLSHVDLLATMQNEANSVYIKSSGQPLYYYPLSLVCYAPWFLLLPPAIALAFKAPRVTDRFLVWFVIIGMAVASLISQKKAVYILPLYPASVLLMASMLRHADVHGANHPRWARYVKWVIGVIGVLIPLAVIGLVGALMYFSASAKVMAANLLLGGLAIWLAVMGLRCLNARPAPAVSMVQALAFALMLLAAMVFHHFLPFLNPYQSVKIFARQVAKQVPVSDPLYLYRRDNFAFPFYAGRFIPDIEQGHRALATHCWLILQRKHLPELERLAVCKILLDNQQLVRAKPIYPVLDYVLIEYLPDTLNLEPPRTQRPTEVRVDGGPGLLPAPPIADGRAARRWGWKFS